MVAQSNLLHREIKGSYSGVSLDLKFYRRITFLYGDSGTGKTFLAKALSEQDIISVCFDYKYSKKERQEWLKDFIREKSGVLIIIDNADIVLDDELRELIYYSKSNQFIIIGRDPRGLHLMTSNIVDIEIVNNTISFVQKLE